MTHGHRRVARRHLCLIVDRFGRSCLDELEQKQNKLRTDQTTNGTLQGAYKEILRRIKSFFNIGFRQYG